MNTALSLKEELTYIQERTGCSVPELALLFNVSRATMEHMLYGHCRCSPWRIEFAGIVMDTIRSYGDISQQEVRKRFFDCNPESTFNELRGLHPNPSYTRIPPLTAAQMLGFDLPEAEQ